MILYSGILSSYLYTFNSLVTVELRIKKEKILIKGMVNKKKKILNNLKLHWAKKINIR